MREITNDLQNLINSRRSDYKSSWLIDCTTCWAGSLDELQQYAEELSLKIKEPRKNTRTGNTEFELFDKEGYAGLIEQPDVPSWEQLIPSDNWIMIVVH